MLTFRKAGPSWGSRKLNNTQPLPMRLTVAPGPSVSGRDWREIEGELFSEAETVELRGAEISKTG